MSTLDIIDFVAERSFQSLVIIVRTDNIILFCGKRIIGIDAVNQQIETAEAEVIKAKKKYDEATDKLKSLLDKKKALQTEELMNAVMKSSRSYEEILRYIQSDSSEEQEL